MAEFEIGELVPRQVLHLKVNPLRLIQVEGPDAQNEYRISIPKLTPYSFPGLSTFLFVASELRLRGKALVQQPHLKNGSVLCWNGEVSALIDHRFVCADIIEIFDGMEVGSFLDNYFTLLEVTVDFGGGE